MIKSIECEQCGCEDEIEESLNTFGLCECCYNEYCEDEEDRIAQYDAAFNLNREI